jgi:hypothetical protein
MKVKITMAFLALFMFAGTAGLATAQDTTKTTHKKTRTLTGCLPKGKAYDIERSRKNLDKAVREVLKRVH